MITVVPSRAFTQRCNGKYDDSEIELLVEVISADPKVGKKLNVASNLYQYHWATSSSHDAEYDVYYIFHSKAQPVLLVNIFKRGTKSVVDKIIETLALEIVNC